MAIFKGKASDDWRNKRSQEQLALGGLPLNAEWRLRTLRENKRLFTSNLTVNELVLARAERISPLGQVTGSSVYHMGWQKTPIYASGVLTTLSEAYNRVWRLALSRLQAEAQALGAHGVVSVRLSPKLSGGRTDLLEVGVQGTAIHWEGAAAPTVPFLSALTGQEFWSLLHSGYRPVGVAFGNCVYYQVTTSRTRSVTQSGIFSPPARWNQELKEYTAGFYKARRSVMAQLEAEAVTVSAEGVLGLKTERHFEVKDVEVEVNEVKQKRSDLLVRFSAIGTAIAPFTGFGPVINYALPLNV